MNITKDTVLEIAAWGSSVSDGQVGLDGEHRHPDGDGGLSWFNFGADLEFGGSYRHLDAIAWLGEAGLAFAARRNLPVAVLTDRVCEIIDQVNTRATRRASIRRAALDGATYGEGPDARQSPPMRQVG